MTFLLSNVFLVALLFLDVLDSITESQLSGSLHQSFTFLLSSDIFLTQNKNTMMVLISIVGLLVQLSPFSVFDTSSLVFSPSQNNLACSGITL